MESTIGTATAWMSSSLVLILGFLFKLLLILWHYCIKKLILYYFSTSFDKDVQGCTTLYEDDKDAGFLHPSLPKIYIKKDSQEFILGHEETFFPYTRDDPKNQEIDLFGEIVTFPTAFSDGDLVCMENAILKLPSEEEASMRSPQFDDVSFIDNSKIKNKRPKNLYRLVTGVEVKDHPLKLSVSGHSTKSDGTEQSEINLIDLSESLINLNESSINLNESLSNLNGASINLNESLINLNRSSINLNGSSINLTESSINLNESAINLTESSINLNEYSRNNLIGVEELRNEMKEMFDSKLYSEEEFLTDCTKGVGVCLEDSECKEKLEITEKLDGKILSDEMKCFNFKTKTVSDLINSYSNLGAKNKVSTEDLEELVNKINGIVDGRKVLEIVNGKLTLNDDLETGTKVKNYTTSVYKSDSITSEEINKLKELQVSKPNSFSITKSVLNIASDDGKAIKNKLKKLFPPMNKIFNIPFAKKSGSDAELKTVSATTKTVRSDNHKYAQLQMDNDIKSDSKQNEYFAFTPPKRTDENKDLESAANDRRIELESSQKQNVPQCDLEENASSEFIPFKWVNEAFQSEDNPKDIQQNSSDSEDQLATQWSSTWVLGCRSNTPKQISSSDGSGILLVKHNQDSMDNCEHGFFNSHSTMEDNLNELKYDWGKTAKKELKIAKSREDIFEDSNFVVQSLRQRKRNVEDREDVPKPLSDYKDDKRSSEDFDLLPVGPLLKQDDDGEKYLKGKSHKIKERRDLLGLDEKKKCIQNLYEKFTSSSADNEKELWPRASNFAIELTSYRPLTEYSVIDEENFETVDLSSPPREDEDDDLELIERPEKSLTFPAKMAVLSRQAEMALRNVSISRMKLESKSSINKLRAKLKNV